MDISQTPPTVRGIVLIASIFTFGFAMTLGCHDESASSRPVPANATDRKETPVRGADSQRTQEPQPTNTSTGSSIAKWHPPSKEGYAGSEACAECHSELTTSYASHPMARSITSVDLELESDRIQMNGEVINPGASREYLVRTVDGRLIHSERTLDTEGNPLYQTDVPIKYVVGSGQRAVAYIASRDQRLLMSPLNWYSQAARYDFAPSHSADDARRFDRRVNDDCLSCHAGQVNEVTRNSSRYADPPFAHAAIGCENCHGPGQNHIAFHGSSESAPALLQDTIVNPEKLDHQRSEAVCYQCHLHAPARLLRPGRSHFDFRPGDRLDDIWTMILLEDTDMNGEKIAPVNQVQQMLESRCYQASESRMGCTTCHDPHGLPSSTERSNFYRSRCLTCHQSDDCHAPAVEREEKGDSCTQCHMPARETTKISHTSQTDHRILRSVVTNTTPQPNPAAPLTTESGTPKFQFLWDSADRLPQWERARAMGMALWLTQPDGNKRPSMRIIEYLAPVFEQHPEDGATATVLGAFWSQYSSPQRAKYYYEAALNDPDVRETALANLITIYYTSLDWEGARKCSEQLLQLDPSNARVLALRADILQHFGDAEAASLAAEKALAINPTLTPVRQWLVKLYQRMNETERASPHIHFLNQLNAKTLPQ